MLKNGLNFFMVLLLYLFSITINFRFYESLENHLKINLKLF